MPYDQHNRNINQSLWCNYKVIWRWRGRRV